MTLSTRLMAAMVALAIVTAGVVGLLALRTFESALVPRALEQFESRALLLVAQLDNYVQGVRSDVGSFRSGAGPEAIIRAHLNGGFDPVDGTPEAEWQRRMGSRQAAIVAAKPAYLQFSMIGAADGGRELVRIDRLPDGSVRMAGDGEKLRRGDAEFFKAALALRFGEIYVSPVGLDREADAGSPRPVLHVATPLQTADRTSFGVMAAKIDLGAIFDRLRAAHGTDSLVYVVNEQGDYLVHPELDREFAFARGPASRVQDDFAPLAKLLGAPKAASEIAADASGEWFGVALAPLRLAEGPWVAVVKASPYSAILAPRAAARNSILLTAFLAILIAAALATLLSRSLTRPLVQMTRAVEALGRGEAVSPPVAAGGEIGVLSLAFVRMADEIRNKAAALKEEMAGRRRLFDTSLDLILVTDRKGRFVQVSPSAINIVGHAPSEMTGRSAVEFIHPADLDHTRQYMRQVRRSRATDTFESRYLHRDGHAVMLAWTGVWSEPEQQHFFIGRDITERKAADEALKQALARQQAVFNSAILSIVTLNESGSVESLNPAAERLFGVTLEDVARRDIGRLIDLGGPADISSATRLRHMLTGDGAIREVLGRRKDDTTFPIDFELAEMPIGDRRMFIVFARDITGRKRNERMKDEFVATVSHELRTPLTSIAGSLGLLAGGAAGHLTDAARRLLTIAHTNSQRLVRLINDILDVEKIESGKVVFALQPVELRALAAQAVEANRGFADSFGVAVRLDSGSAEAVVRVDPDRMTQVIINLLSNAVKFSPRGAEVVVTTANNGTTARLAVRDHGPGVPDEYKTRVFEKFVQVDTSDARQKGGTGLGLSIVRQIMLRLGGEVSLEPAPGGGSVFHVELPCWDQIEFLETERLGRAGNALILLCEDDPDAAAVLSERLRGAGFPTDVAYTAQEAVKGAATRSYAAILVDLQLPDSDGISLIKHLRAQPQYQNTPIVVVSADPKRGRDDQRAATLNVLDWLGKPVDTDRLIRVLNRPMVREAFVRPRILHVDDDRDVLRLVAQALASTAEVVSVQSIDEARHVLDSQHFDLAVLDVALAEGFGLDLLPDLCGADGQPIPVVVFSAQDSPDVAARVLAVLSKSRASIDSLVSTLRRLVAGRVSRTPRAREVA